MGNFCRPEDGKFPPWSTKWLHKVSPFLCLWESRAKHEHWTRKDWPPRKDMVVGAQNVINESLVARDRIILPPLHIKLGLMKQFVKALNKEGSCFEYIAHKLPGITMEKLKAGIFDGPQIRQLM